MLADSSNLLLHYCSTDEVSLQHRYLKKDILILKSPHRESSLWWIIALSVCKMCLATHCFPILLLSLPLVSFFSNHACPIVPTDSKFLEITLYHVIICIEGLGSGVQPKYLVFLCLYQSLNTNTHTNIHTHTHTHTNTHKVTYCHCLHTVFALMHFLYCRRGSPE